ncbi:Gti1/Pac2 family-domain-containing protein [Chlamydoabsidia padenii]|nr:Gti1/Pac2 family-domain-containing protein [Chlamydoabsidia padenii]
MLVTESFHGFIETTQDVLLIFEGCRRGLLPRICRRLQERERKMIRSGSVFVFDQRESGIKRWTDGRVWSPSRILGNFLIYRELDKRNPGDKKMSISSASSIGSMDERRYSYSIENATSPTPSPTSTTAGSVDRNRDRQLVGSLSDTYKFRQDGLIKKTMSIMVNGVSQHLISYYDPRDVLQQKLRTPSSVPELASLEISPELLVKQNFRIPPMVEPTFDHTADGLGMNSNNNNNNGGTGPLTPPDSLSGSLLDRRMHPLRSMSLGSVRPDLPLAASHAVYPTSYQQEHTHRHQQQHQQSLDLVKQEQSPTTSTFVYHPPPPLPVPNSVYNTFSAVPSPTSMSSSPSTPILSPARASSFQHQRHYSTSSASSSSLSSSVPRYDPRHYSTDYSTSPSTQQPPFQSHHYQQHQHQQHHQQNVGQIQLMADGYNQHHDRGSMNHSQHQQQENHAANLGQLLNPVHPLQQNDTAQHNNNNPLAQSITMTHPSASYADYSSTGYDGKETNTQGFSMADGNNGSGGSGLVPMSRYPMTNQHSAPTLDSLYTLDTSAGNANGFQTYY